MAKASIIPINVTQQSPHVSVTLGEQRYILRFFFVIRTSSWYAHLDLADGTRLISGERLSVDYPLFFDRSDSRIPNGLLHLKDVKKAKGDPLVTFEGLGDRWQLIYVEKDDLLQYLTE